MEGLKKFKWLYLWIAAAGLIAFGLIVLIWKEFGQSVVIFISGLLLIAFVLIRFIPLIKTTRNKWAITINAIEMFVDLVVGVLLIVFTVKEGTSATDFNKIYPFILGGVLYLRGLVYLLELSFFEGKKEAVKFIVHLAILTVGVVIMARYDSFTTESFRWIFGLAFCLSGGIAGVDGGNNYRKYREKYSSDKNKKEKVKEEKEIDFPSSEDTPNYIPPKENNINQDSDYVC
ncbi:hypothetical protein J6Y73_04175 [bacterium]|nr:hypothetical protein [bacterium]